jgi:hypothetical protein
MQKRRAIECAEQTRQVAESRRNSYKEKPRAHKDDGDTEQIMIGIWILKDVKQLQQESANPQHHYCKSPYLRRLGSRPLSSHGIWAWAA